MSYIDGLQHAIKVIEVSYELLKNKELVPTELLLDIINDLNAEINNEVDKIIHNSENIKRLQ